MNQPPLSVSSSPAGPPDDRLDSWKDIAAYLKRDVTTVQRWEKREGMPVHRHLHDKMGSVSALRSELDEWVRSRRGTGAEAAGQDAAAPQGVPAAAAPVAAHRKRWIPAVLAAACAAALAAGWFVWSLDRRDAFWRNPLADAAFVQLTESDGPEPAVALSRDGRFVAYLADRDGRVGVWMTQLGTGQFHNLTRGIGRELVNASVRTLGFSPDGSLVTFWTRTPSATRPAAIGIWAVPLLGGPPRPYLDGAAEFDWSSDGSRVVYHTPAPGDPMFVGESGRLPDASRQIFAASPGLHSHFLRWSMDQAFIYFVQGALPDRMDIWRIRPSGGPPERITHHDARVSHPVFVSPRTLVYLATDPSGAGPWMFSVDVERRVPHRISSGIDAYTSLAASADGTRLAAARATARTALWRLPPGGAASGPSAGSRIPLTTENGSAPRLGGDYLLYVSSHAASDSIWKQQGETATELWTAAGARIPAGPSIAPAGGRIAFVAEQGGRALLYVMQEDGTGPTIIDKSLAWEGAPAWAPDGRSISAAARVAGVSRLFRVPLDGQSPVAFAGESGAEPVWSPDGRFLVFSGPDIGTTFTLRAMRADGQPFPLPQLSLSRGARRLRFRPGGGALLVLKGELHHKDLWSIDLDTGAEQQLTSVAPDFDVRDFDISPDGRDIVLERAQAHSALVLLDLKR